MPRRSSHAGDVNAPVTSKEPRSVPPDARTRVVDAGIRCVAREGMQGASMAVIAAEAGVSKALLHYHFADRAELLAEIVAVLGKRLVARERGALEQGQAASAVDTLWRWLDGELQRGELRALLELRTARESSVREALDNVDELRRAGAAATVDRLFVRLGLVPRIPVQLIGDTTIAFVDGMVLNDGPGRETRMSFDVFWLAILSLGD
jgi:AcrR family transcriptional regulator